MSPILAIALLAPFSAPGQTQAQGGVAAAMVPTPSPFVYKPVAGEKAVYSVRYGVKQGSQQGGLSQTLTTEVLSIEPDGSARVRLSFSDVKATGMAKGQPFDTSPTEVTMDKYGRFKDAAALGGPVQILGVGFSLPDTDLAEKKWVVFPDPLTHGIPGMEVEGSIKSRKGSRVVLVSRTKEEAQGQSFTRETAFDTEGGRLLSARIRGGMKGGPSVELDIERKEVKR